MQLNALPFYLLTKEGISCIIIALEISLVRVGSIFYQADRPLAFAHMRDIEGFGNRYAITKNGRVWRKAIIGYDKRNRPKKQGGYFLKTLKTQHGYLAVDISLDGVTKRKYIHRLLAQAHIPNLENKPQINHKNGIKTDNRLRNLEWCTIRENVLHAFSTGLIKPHEGLRGEKSNSAKLTWKQVEEIRKLRSAGETLEGIGKKYGVHLTTIWLIVKNRNWKN